MEKFKTIQEYLEFEKEKEVKFEKALNKIPVQNAISNEKGQIIIKSLKEWEDWD